MRTPHSGRAREMVMAVHSRNVLWADIQASLAYAAELAMEEDLIPLRRAVL